MNKQLDLFGGDSGEVFVERTKKQVFEDYDSFVAKFDANAPKTTDDCYTPQPVYDAVLQWLKQQVNIEGRPVVRPFYPGGDYKNEVYPENCVVVDNPPFSILAEIVRFYIATKIDFFLFAPGLTLFSSSSSSLCTAIVADAQIRYANNAVVCTGFLSSLFGDARIIVSTTLNCAINSAMGKGQKAGRVEINYPDNVVSSALLNAAVGGGDFIINAEECHYIRALDAQRRFNKTIFGNGYLLSTRMSELFAKAKAKAKGLQTFQKVWELSQREINIIKRLDAKDNPNDNSTEVHRTEGSVDSDGA